MRSTAGAAPSKTASTEPSPTLRTVPATPSACASRRHDSRNPTPWTRPRTRTRQRTPLSVSATSSVPVPSPVPGGASAPDRALRAAPDRAVGLEAVGREGAVRARRDADPLGDAAPHGELRLPPAGDGVLVVAGVGAGRADDQPGRGPAGHHAEDLLGPGGLDAADPGGDHDGVGRRHRLLEQALVAGRGVDDA